MVKAAVLLEPKKLEVLDYDKPKVADDALLAKIKCCGVCGTDVHKFLGYGKGVPYPLILGHEFSGVVEQLGPKANEALVVHGGELAEGDAVTVVPGLPCGECHFCRNFPDRPNLCTNRLIYGGSRTSRDPPHLYGGFAEYIYVEPRSWVYKLPEGMSFKLGALAEPASVSTRALERAIGPEMDASGLTVVVQGAGAIGLLATAAAKAAGAEKVINIDRVKERLKMAKELGADELVNMKEFVDPREWIERVQELTDGVGADVVIECTGVPEAFLEGLEMVRRGGKYVEMGHFTDPGGIELHPHAICYRDMDILGSWVYPMAQFGKSLEILNSGKFPLEEIFTHEFGVEDTLKAIQTSERGECVKALVVP